MSTMEEALTLIQRMRTGAFTLLLRRAFFSLGTGARIVPPLRFGNLRRVAVGDRVFISQGCWIQVIEPCVPGDWPVISIGNDVKIGMDVTITAAASVVLEEHAALARNVFICDHGHEFHDPSVPVILQGIRKVAPVRIGAGSWLGHGVVVLPGVSIGRNAVIGANAVVRSDIPDFCVAVGSPARVVRRYDERRAAWEEVSSA